MNQDFDQNEPRRDGERRSSGRRDDDRAQGSDRPRFRQDRDERSSGPRNERPRFGQGRNNDRPRFGQDRNDGDARPRNTDRPRFDRDRNDNSRRFDDRNAGSQPSRFRRDDNPRFDRRDNDSRDRQDRNYGDARRNPTGGPRDFDQRRPRFDNDRPNDRSGRNHESGERRYDDRNRNDERPRFGRDRSGDNSSLRSRDERSRFDPDRDNDRPRFDRDRNDRYAGAGPRPSFNRDRDTDRNDDRPRFNRDHADRSRSHDRPRFDQDAGPQDARPRDARPRDSRNDRFAGPRNSRFDKPGFKRVGGFNREADERNRFGSEREENPRFSPEQRKASGDRRTGRYDEALNYNSEPKRDFRNRGRDRDERSSEPRNRDEKPKRPAANDEPGLTRLNRYIANSGVCSRREADELIERGDISVNGKVVTEMGYKVKEGDTVKYGTKVLNPERFAYVLLNKPKDYITTTDDPEERKTVMELVADAGNFRLYPVGRLDRNTTGLLLLTNDGELADRLTHPSNNIRKIYQVEIDKPITTEHFEAIQQGIELEDGPIKPDALSIVTPDAQVVGIEIHSGRNRIVRRIFEHFGYEVTKLDRTVFAGLTKKDLPRGKWRFLDPKEVVKLKYFN